MARESCLRHYALRRAKAPLAGVLLMVTSVPGLAADPVLAQILGNVRDSYNRQERPMAIFDLEGTLFDNRPRILQILKECAADKAYLAKGYVTAEAAQRLANATLPIIEYRLPDTLARLGITNSGVIQNVAAFWGERFHNEEYLKYDTPNPGAVDFVRTLYSNGARIVYLTGRDAPRQLLGTIKALRDHGFPIGIQGTELIMKPTAQTQDAVFKQQVTNYLRHYGKVIATFDNEPSNVNIFRRAFPDATVVKHMAPSSPNPPPLLPNIYSLATFN